MCSSARRRLYCKSEPAYADNARGWNDSVVPKIGCSTIMISSSKIDSQWPSNDGTDHRVGRILNAFVRFDMRWQNRAESSIGVSSVTKTGKPAIFFGVFFIVSFARMCAHATLPIDEIRFFLYLFYCIAKLLLFPMKSKNVHFTYQHRSFDAFRQRQEISEWFRPFFASPWPMLGRSMDPLRHKRRSDVWMW